jgi:hypothetical protein
MVTSAYRARSAPPPKRPVLSWSRVVSVSGETCTRRAQSFQGDLTVDTDTLIVNSTTDRVGINKAVPTVALDVVGDVVISDDFTVDTDTLRVDAVTDRVGINVSAPDASLHVVGNAHVQNTTEAFSTVTGAMTIAGGLGVTANVHATQFHGDGSKLTGLVTTLEDVANNGNTMSNVIIFRKCHNWSRHRWKGGCFDARTECEPPCRRKRPRGGYD